MNRGNCLPHFHSIPSSSFNASSTDSTIAQIPPVHSSKNFFSAGVSWRADGGFCPSFTSSSIVSPLNPTNKSGIPSPWLTILTVAPALRSAATMSFWLASILFARLIADSLSHILTGDNIAGTFLFPSTDRKQ